MHPKIIEYNGYKFRLSGRYYRRNVWGSPGPSNLHRAVWEFHNGPIPNGHEIHHKDEDTFNNAVENLECVPMHEHQSAHLKGRILSGAMPPPSKLTLERATAWHRSEDGRKWHTENALANWQKREWVPVVCEICGNGFTSPWPTRAKFCHPNCRAKAFRLRQAKEGKR